MMPIRRVRLAALRAALLRHRLWLPVILLGLLFAGLGQAMHVHPADEPGHEHDEEHDHDHKHGLDRDHCAFCLQIDRLGTGAVAPSASLLVSSAFSRLVVGRARSITQRVELRYHARGPPAR